MKQKGHILICGASIAGPVLAFWLQRAGFKTTVIERSPKFRDGGQNIDVKGCGKTIVERMGLLAQVKAKTTHERGLRFVDGQGSVIAEFPKEGELSMTQEIEIRRGDLSRVFYEATKEQTIYRFGVTIKSVSDQPGFARVELSDGSSADYDLVVSAEGIGSSTRKMVMDEFVQFKYLGIWMAYFRIPKISRDENWARWFNAVGGRVLLMRPSSVDKESVCLDFRSENPSVEHEPLERQHATIRQVLTDMGGESSRISENLADDDDLYMGPVSQVKARRWSKGRFVLVGDAAYAPAPVTGMGTTLAIAGAYVLAGELAKSQNVLEALQAYEKVLRPFVEKSQWLPPGVPVLAHPKSKAGIKILNTAVKIAASRAVQVTVARLRRQTKKQSPSEVNGWTLPLYDF